MGSAKWMLLWVLMLVLMTTGCASISTFDQRQRGQPLIFSGTRLNVHGICYPGQTPKHFAVQPPAYPWLDLAPSAVLDVLVLPVTVAGAAYFSVT